MARILLQVVAAVASLATLTAQNYSVSPSDLPRDRVDTIAKAAQPGSDDWDSEGRFGEWDDVLKKLADALIADEDWTRFFTADVSGTALAPAKLTLRKDGAVSAEEGRPEEALLTHASFVEAFSAWRQSFSRIDAAKFKIVSIGESSSDLVYFVSGSTPAKTTLQLRGDWSVDWRRDDSGAWRISGLRAGEIQRSEARSKIFSDITAAALGSNDSFVQQMQIGLDEWRRRLDSSLGVSVVGHHGVSIADVNGDGWEDLYVLQPAGLPNRLYLNRGGMHFEDAGAESGVEILDPSSHALFADFDGDSEVDLFLVSSRLMLFLNDGAGHFSLATNSGLEGFADRDGSWMGAAVADYNGDGKLDVYVCAHTQSAWSASSDEDLPEPYYDANNGAPNLLLVNRGGRFEDVTQSSGMDVNNRRFSFAAAWADYDNDGDADLYVANDFGRNNLYQNQGDGTFRDVAREAGVEDLAAGMSVAWEDYDNDGSLDLYVGNMWSSAGLRVTGQSRFSKARTDAEAAALRRHARGNSLFRNRGDGSFEDVSESSRTTLGRWAWSSDFFDFDNDGLEDLYVTNGFITGDDTGDL